MDDGIGGVLFTIAIVVLIIYVIIAVTIITLVLAMVALGFASFFMAKSGRSLVPQVNPATAFTGAIAWSATLAVGCIVGSIGLLIVMNYGIGADPVAEVVARHTQQTSPDDLAGFFLNWIAVDAVKFFFNVTCIVYLANRIYVARKNGGSHWLAVIPPLAAVVLFFVVSRWPMFIEALANRELADLNAILRSFVAELWLPVDLLIRAFTVPHEVLVWGRQTLIDSEGSFFQLGSHFPSIFGIVAILIAGRHLFNASDPDLI